MALTDEEKKYLLNRMSSTARKVSLGDLVIDGGGGGGVAADLSNLTDPTAINTDLTFAAGAKSINAEDDLTIQNINANAAFIIQTDGKLFARSGVENAFCVSNSASSSDGGIVFRPQQGANMTYIQGSNGDATGGGDLHIQQGGGDLKLGHAGSSRVEISCALAHTDYQICTEGFSITGQGPSVAILDMDTAGGTIDLPPGPSGLVISFSVKGSGGATWTLAPFDSGALDSNLSATVTESLRIIYIEEDDTWYKLG